MADWTTKQHDTYPPLPFQLKDQNGNIDLTTAVSVKVILKNGGTTVTGTCVIDTAASGIGHYNWVAGDTDVVGTYQGEFEITWPSSKIETVPNDTTFSVLIVSDLG